MEPMSATFDMTEREQAIYALAASWASIDGKLEAFGKERFARTREEAKTGHHEGYLIEAEEMLVRMEKRGFTLTRLVNPIRSAALAHGVPLQDAGT